MLILLCAVMLSFGYVLAGGEGYGARRYGGRTQAPYLQHPQSCRNLYYPGGEDPWCSAQG